MNQIDFNNAVDRVQPYANEFSLLNEGEQKIRLLEEQLRKARIEFDRRGAALRRVLQEHTEFAGRMPQTPPLPNIEPASTRRS